MTEGDPARINEIHIVGNKAFSESTLKDLFDQDTGNWMSWYTKSDRYARNKLNADLETLRSYYLQRGYLEFRVDSTQVAISPDKQTISLTLNIHEGERFVVSGVMVWVTLQALINIAVVLRLLPVLGVPLPLISAGGSSLIATLGAIGIVLAVERENHSNPLAGRQGQMPRQVRRVR